MNPSRILAVSAAILVLPKLKVGIAPRPTVLRMEALINFLREKLDLLIAGDVEVINGVFDFGKIKYCFFEL